MFTATGGGGSRACGEAEGAFEGGAFARVIFGPHVVNDTRLGHVSTSMVTMHGRVEASWRADYVQTQTQTHAQTHAQTQTQTHAHGDLITVTFNFTLPSNTVGELRIPAWRPADAISVWTDGVVVFAKGSFVPGNPDTNT